MSGAPHCSTCDCYEDEEAEAYEYHDHRPGATVCIHSGGCCDSCWAGYCCSTLAPKCCASAP